MSEEYEPDYKMPTLFLDWISESQIDITTELLTCRWNAISDLINEVDSDNLPLIVRIAIYGISPEDDDENHWFKAYFKAKDPLFKVGSGKSGYELKILARATILAHFHYGIEHDWRDDCIKLAQVVLCASCGDRSIFQGEIDIVGSAEQALHNLSVKIRNRPLLKNYQRYKFTEKSENVFESYDNNPKAAFLELKESTLSITNNLISELIGRQSKIIEFLKVQDEEINILYWLLNRYSTRLSKNLDELSEPIKAVVTAVELADATTGGGELVSFSEILSKIGMGNDELTFDELCENVANYMTSLDVTIEDYEADILPIFSAFSMIAEHKDWKKVYVENGYLSPEHKKNIQQWTIQMYREWLYIKTWG